MAGSRSATTSPRRADVVVVGGGAAGLHVALEAAAQDCSVVLVARKPLAESSSFWAQGGLAAAIAEDDSPARHAEDTLNAGRGLCEPKVVETLAHGAPEAVAQLERRGVQFDRDDEGLALALEGGHSARRVVHAGGAATGRAITSRLAELVAQEGQIEVMEGASAVSLAACEDRCAGVQTDRGTVVAPATVLATGGGAALWRRTTNPWGAIAAGSLLALGLDAELGGLELCQFHPTALALPGHPADGSLITEAVRGEGALLVGADGRRFTDELAPRDQVTAAILDRIAADGTSAVGLDLAPVRLESFPSIERTLREAGLDPGAGPIPVAPAAHYLVGGVRAGIDGETSVEGLYAVGEAAYTGLHGANRLASNSLSECFVFGSRAAAAACRFAGQAGPPSRTTPSDPFVPPMAATRDRVWELAGPRRDGEELAALLDDPYPPAALIAASALARTESRGSHRRSDHPNRDPELDRLHTVVRAAGPVLLAPWRAPGSTSDTRATA